MALLEILQGSSPGKLIELIEDKIVIGRHPTSSIILDNHAVSRRHARILRSNGLYFLEDLRSRNGTWLNGQRLQTRAPLRDEDQIKVCDVLFRFLDGVPNASEGQHQDAASRATTTTSDMPSIRESDRMLTTTSGPDPILSAMDLTAIRSSRLTIKPEVKLRAIMGIIDSIRNKLALEELLPGVLDELLKIFPQTDRGMILLPDASRTFRVRAAVTRHGQGIDRTQISQTLLHEVLQRKQAILTEDAESDSRFSSSESLSNLKIRSMMCVPLLDREGEIQGVLELESRDLQSRFTEEDLELLGSTASLVALSVENAALHEQTLLKRDLERELEFATQVQLGFLPTERPQISNFEFVDYYEPAHSVGGDIFDYIPLNDGRWAIVVGDVAGKGVPAALLMARVYSLIRGQVTSSRTAAESLSSLNQAVCNSGLGHSFVTLTLLILDPVRHRLEWANAGHIPPFLRKFDGTIEELTIDDPDFPLGVRADRKYHQGTHRIEDGQLIMLITDGITETMDAQRHLFGTERVRKFLSKPKSSLQELMDSLIEEIENFRGNQPQRDDMCVIAFHCCKSAST